MPTPPEFGPYFAGVLGHYGRLFGIPGADWEIVQVEFRRVFGTPLMPRRVGRDLTDPTRTEHLTQRIARDSSSARDRYMAEKLVDAVQRHRRVFAVMGASHVVMQEPALRSRLAEFRARSLGPEAWADPALCRELARRVEVDQAARSAQVAGPPISRTRFSIARSRSRP